MAVTAKAVSSTCIGGLRSENWTTMEYRLSADRMLAVGTCVTCEVDFYRITATFAQIKRFFPIKIQQNVRRRHVDSKNFTQI